MNKKPYIITFQIPKTAGNLDYDKILSSELKKESGPRINTDISYNNENIIIKYYASDPTILRANLNSILRFLQVIENIKAISENEPK